MSTTLKIIFKVNCDKIGTASQLFMIYVECAINTPISTLRDRLDKLYPFIKVDDVADLDEEIAEAFDTVWSLHHNFKDFPKAEAEEEEEEEEEDGCFLTVTPIIALSTYTGTTQTELDQFHDLLNKYPVGGDLKKIIHENHIYVANGTSYHIDSKIGRFNFDGHSYDSVEGHDMFVDQLLNSSERYVFTKSYLNNYDDKENTVELSTQQCILVDSYKKDSSHQPYIMVNQSGLRQLERLGEINLFRIRVGEPEKESIDVSNSDKDSFSLNEKYAKVFQIYSDMASLFKGCVDDSTSLSPEEIDLLANVIDELVPILDEVQNELPKPERKAGLVEINKMIFRYIFDSVKWWLRTWILSGLFIEIGFSFLQYVIITALAAMVMDHFDAPNVTFLIVPVLGLFTENTMKAIEKIGNRGELRAFTWVYKILRAIKTNMASVLNVSFYQIALFCISYRRPIYRVETNTEDTVDVEMQQAGVLAKGFLYLLRFLQDMVLLLLTLLPPFAEIYRRALLEERAKQESRMDFGGR